MDAVVVRLRLIGQMEAWTIDSETILPPGRKTRALLAIVALAQPRPVLRSRLAELLWSRRPEEQARASLRQEIHRLLEVLAPVKTDILSINRDSIALRPGTIWVDVEEVLRATTTHPGPLALLDADLLEELDGVDPAFDVWLHAERERLRDRARGVAEALLNEADAESLIPNAQQLLTIDRAHEGAWRALMRAHAERGERGMAIQSYDRCRAVLSDLLDATPSPETQALLAEIRSGKAVRPNPAAAPAPPEVAFDSRPSTIRGGAKLGVLPLALIGTDDTEAHLAFGLAEEITSGLARFRWLFLVSSSSVAQFMGEARDDAALRRTLGLDYVLDGSVQRVANRLRITVRLVDLQDGSQIVWARRFDRQVDDLLTLQDEVAAEVVAQIDPEIMLIESRRAAHRPTQHATAYDLVLRSLPALSRLERTSFMAAGDLLRQAIKLEPEYASAHAQYALWLHLLARNDWADDPYATQNEAVRAAEAAITLDPQDARGFTIAGTIRAHTHHRLHEAAALHDRALALNPNLAMAWALSAFTYIGLGEWDEAQRRLDRYKTLSPMDPGAYQYDTGFCLLAVMRRDYEAAVTVGRTITEINPSFSTPYKPYLAALGHLGRAEDAAGVARRLLAIEPDFTLQRYERASLFSRQEDRDHMITGLRLAGIPEG